MKTMALALAAGAAMFAGSVVVSGSTGPAAHSDVQVRAAPQAAQNQTAPAPVGKQAVSEQRAHRNVRYSRGIPAAIKNRAGGERAHRQWRKVRSSGRKAA